MTKFFAGAIVGILLMTAAIAQTSPATRLGATPASNGSFPGIYNATPTALGDGYGAAILTDRYGRVIASSTSQ
jgi:hypothetical protein